MNALAIATLNTTSSTALALQHDTPFLFKQVETNALANLFPLHQAQAEELRNLTALLQSANGRALNTLLNANGVHLSGAVQKLTALEPALRHLDASFWSQALNLTDVYEYMPHMLRKEWDDLIASCKTPAFTMEAVIPTLQQLLGSRERYLAETIDTIFQGLSGDHVTNIPQGFYHRMIMPSKYGKGKAEPTETVEALIADLRGVVAFFMGRKGVGLNDTKAQIRIAGKTPGQLIALDGGAIKIRVYQVGTVHIEVHPDMAWRLNHMLSLLYPQSLPPKFRKTQAYTKDTPPLQSHLLSGIAMNLLESLSNPLKQDPSRPAHHKDHKIKDTSKFCVPYDVRYLTDGNHRPDGWEELSRALSFCGGVPVFSESGRPGFSFDFPFEPLRDALLLTGSIPEQKSHQYYHTSETLAKRAVSWADIHPSHRCVEPSAGQGHIAQWMPSGTQCVEISPIHCAILQAKGLKADCADFLEWAKTAGRYDRIVMNPPFCAQQALHHTQAAAGLLDTKGVLVAILPASMLHTVIAPGFIHEWSERIDHDFSDTGTDVSVVLLKLSKK